MNCGREDFYTNLLNQRSSVDDRVILESQDDMDYYLNQNTLVSTQISQSGVGIGSTSKKSRGGNFSVEEDNLIVSAWLNNSIDAVQGNEQKHKAFWLRVWEYFHKNKQFTSDRTQNSLMHRWSAIQLATNKFCGCFAQIESRQQSGLTENDRIGQAKLMYQELYKGSFQFDHSWHLLRFQPKWLEDFQKKSTKVGRTCSPLTPELVNLGDDDVSNEILVDIERPPGRKVEKERQRKSKNLQSMSSPLIGMLDDLKEDRKKKLDILERTYLQDQERIRQEQERIDIEKARFQAEQVKEKERMDRTYLQDQERIRQEQERIDIEKAKFEAEQVKEEERIMLMDISGLSPMKKEYYKRRKIQILDQRKET